MDKSTTYFVFGKSMIPKNIIANNISGLIPNNIGGATACSTAPIPTNNDKITKIRVFNFTSPHLNYAFYFSTVHSLSAAETRSEERRVGKECRCRWGCADQCSSD